MPLLGKFIQKSTNFGDFGAVRTKVKFGMMVQTWDSLPAPNFVKIAQGHLSLREKIFTMEFEILAILAT